MPPSDSHVSTAKSRLDRGGGEPEEKYIDPGDVKTAFEDLQGGWSADITLHGVSVDPHAQYLNEARGDARYSRLGHSHSEYLPLTGGTLTGPLTFDHAGGGGVGVDMALGRITNLSDPQADGDAASKSYVDDVAAGIVAGEPAPHDHDHGDLTGLGDDDHPQYLNNARGDARYVPTTGGTFTGPVTFEAANTYWSAASGFSRFYRYMQTGGEIADNFYVDGVRRAKVVYGGTIIWQVYDEAGVSLGLPMQITSSGYLIVKAPVDPLNPATKQYVDDATAGVPKKKVLALPAGSGPQVFNHYLNTTDVQVEVYRTATGDTVAVDVDRGDPDQVLLMFDSSVSYAAGEYTAVVVG